MVVAEIGLNHLGDKNILDKYLKLACDVDAITIQILSDSFFQNDEYLSFKLSDEILIDFIDKAHSNGYKVGLVIDDYKKVGIFDSSKISFYKILSKDIGNNELLKSIFKTSAKDIYISTGMSDYGVLDRVIPSLVRLDDRVKLIHTQLSNEVEDVNLKAIEVMRKKYRVPVAYGHHCMKKNVVYTSLGFFPESIFFYIKGDDNKKYPDDLHAISTDIIVDFVGNITCLQKSIGSGVKVLMDNNLIKG
jgi:sialic acid synthase SpsE